VVILTLLSTLLNSVVDHGHQALDRDQDILILVIVHSHLYLVQVVDVVHARGGCFVCGSNGIFEPALIYPLASDSIQNL
jgi:hypothetical protein